MRLSERKHHLHHHGTETKNIITLEDPVEYKLAEVTQVHIHEAIGFSFASALRSVLRQDPDIVMVGEIRDMDTAEIAARAALTGHMGLSTLHTNDTVSTITRLIDIGLKPFLVSAAVSGIIAKGLLEKFARTAKSKSLRLRNCSGSKSKISKNIIRVLVATGVAIPDIKAE